jgi:carbon storage regulator
MLVLNRRLHEEIVIDDHIRIRVLAIKKNRVRIGIIAHPDTRVNRAEIQQMIEQMELVAIGEED